ncbi:hypothetical protein EYF80_049639 [Liparis tanakae]|uniref:Uncharacterized protein n=1 Tax=Liparis tanakae TaxID=230148 RepID=A0A4Z2FH02_9TELE|nr:hypothetical protein EYF80_049639 [Liparis tanakae]
MRDEAADEAQVVQRALSSSAVHRPDVVHLPEVAFHRSADHLVELWEERLGASIGTHAAAGGTRKEGVCASHVFSSTSLRWGGGASRTFRNRSWAWRPHCWQTPCSVSITRERMYVWLERSWNSSWHLQGGGSKRVSQAPPVVEQGPWQERHRGTPALSTACR